MLKLPIDKIKAEVMRALGSQPRLVVTAPTGSGKSTRLPLWLYEAFEGPVLVVEPRRVACRALATFLSQERGEKAGALIGYKVRFEQAASEKTRILFVTPGVALRLLSGAAEGDPSAWPFHAVMIDEFHERGWETDLLAMLLRRERPGPNHRAWVLTSATLAATALAKTLGASHLAAQGRTFPVEISYASAQGESTGRDLERRVAAAVKGARGAGDVLVFLPGKAEISAARQALTGWAQAHDVALLPVHASLPMGQLADALKPKHPQRRVFLATNVAETSLTLPGVTTVVDGGLARMKLHRAGRSTLALVPIASDAADQRAGRAGRVAPGRCVRLWGRSARMRPHTPPALLRIELDELVLRAAACGVNVDMLEEAPWIDPPPTFALARARERLYRMEALCEGSLSPTGEAVSNLPTEAHLARLVIGAPQELQPTLLALVALLERRRDLFARLDGLNAGQREDAFEAREELLKGAESEVEAQLRALSMGSVSKHRLNKTSLREARELHKRLAKVLGVPPLKGPPLVGPSLIRHLLTVWPEGAFVMRARAARKQQRGKGGREKAAPWGNGELELMIESYRPPHPTKEGEGPEAPKAGLVLDHSWISFKGLQVRGRGRLLLPVRFQDLVDAGLGEDEVGAPRLESGRVFGVVSTVYAGQILEVREVPLRGTNLRAACAALIARGSLFKGAFFALQERLHLWSLARRFLDIEAPDPPPLEGYLEQRLADLGLEESEELSLLGGEDLLPELPEAMTWDPRALEKLREDFPRTWRFQGQEFLCLVQGSRVVLEQIGGKKVVVPPSGMVPRFRGLKVVARKASREVVVR